MPYIICKENNYLQQTTDGFFIVNNIEQAGKWKKIHTANNVCKNVNSCKKFKGYKLEVKFVSQENKIINPPAQPVHLNYDISDKIKEISEFIKEIEQRRLFLLYKIHEIDLDIVDIEHAAEFYNLNAAQGYQIYKMLHDARVQRREFKDELQKIELLLGTSMRSMNMENLEKSIKGMDSRKYSPRINKKLFGV